MRLASIMQPNLRYDNAVTIETPDIHRWFPPVCSFARREQTAQAGFWIAWLPYRPTRTIMAHERMY